MEIEAKFRVDDDDTFRDLLALDTIGPFGLAPAPHAEQQRNTYFDTSDGRLRAGQYGLRIRDLGDRRVATLKGAAKVHDGMYERDEWEAAIDDDDRPETWPPGDVRDRTLALLGGRALQPILRIDTLRRHIFAERAGVRVAELSLDEGTIRAGGGEARLRELEIELLPAGTRAAFEELVGLLRERFSLVPEDRSKLQRGLTLLDQARGEAGDV